MRPATPIRYREKKDGYVASWLEHITHNDGVTGSNPVVATIFFAGVAKLVDAPDLGSGAARCASSSLASRTIHQKALYGWGIAKR